MQSYKKKPKFKTLKAKHFKLTSIFTIYNIDIVGFVTFFSFVVHAASARFQVGYMAFDCSVGTYVIVKLRIMRLFIAVLSVELKVLSSCFLK